MDYWNRMDEKSVITPVCSENGEASRVSALDVLPHGSANRAADNHADRSDNRVADGGANGGEQKEHLFHLFQI